MRGDLSLSRRKKGRAGTEEQQDVTQEVGECDESLVSLKASSIEGCMNSCKVVTVHPTHLVRLLESLGVTPLDALYYTIQLPALHSGRRMGDPQVHMSS